MSVAGTVRRFFRFGRHLARDEGGAALIYVSIALTVFMGFAALVIDGSRLFTLDTELQSAADAIALAGAAELDGDTDAIDRAETAMANLVQNSQTFGTGGMPVTAYQARFLSELPADDAEPIEDDLVTADDGEARFVEVQIQGDDRREINTIFAPSIGGEDTAMAGATAVAGFSSAVCKFTPLFICNPYESTDDSLSYFTSQISSVDERRRIIALKKAGSGASYFPGNFGFLESDLGPGANQLKDSLARVDPGTCFRRDGVETQTGAVNSARHAINTRFDLYDGSFNGQKNNASYRPAQNVTKGYKPKGAGAGAACNQEPVTTGSPPVAMGFPIDSVIGSNRVGNGTWNFNTYWSVNHPGVTAPNSWSNANLPTRYDVYLWELAHGIPNNAPSGENGRPTCSASTPSAEPDRRIMYAAVLNCSGLGLKGGSGDNVPALTFIKMFVTQPMTKLPGTGHVDEDDTLYVEIVDTVKPGVDDEVVHDIVQLYR